LGEQVAAALEDSFFDAVLGAQRHQSRRAALLLRRQRFAEPGHGAIEVVEVEVGGAVQQIVVFPLVGGAVTTWLEQAVQHREEDRAFNGEREVAWGQELFEHRGTAGLLPEAFKDEHGAQAEGAHRREVALLMSGENEEFLGEACAGPEESVDGAALLEFVEPAEGGEDRLLRAAVAPVVFDELKVGTWARLLGAEEHGDLRMRATMSVIGMHD
jgi:hypothetical protein